MFLIILLVVFIVFLVYNTEKKLEPMVIDLNKKPKYDRGSYGLIREEYQDPMDVFVGLHNDAVHDPTGGDIGGTREFISRRLGACGQSAAKSCLLPGGKSYQLTEKAPDKEEAETYIAKTLMNRNRTVVLGKQLSTGFTDGDSAIYDSQ